MPAAKFTYTQMLERSAQILEESAQALKDCHTVRGRWSGEFGAEAKEEHDERRALAKALRSALKYAKPNPLGGPAKVFDACADEIRAGTPTKKAMALYGLAFAAAPKKALRKSGA